MLKLGASLDVGCWNLELLAGIKQRRRTAKSRGNLATYGDL